MTQCILCELKRSEEAVVVDISGTDEVRQRFFDLGIFPGLSLSCFSQVMLGGPLTIQIENSKLSLRQEDAAHVIVNRI